MKKLTIIISLFFIFTFYGHAQKIDYLEIRDSLNFMSCGVQKIADIEKTKNNLESLDTTLLSANIDVYYYDLGMCYCLYYQYNKFEKYSLLSISSFKKAIHHNPENPSAYTNLALSYYFLDDCTNCLLYLDLYKENIPETNWDNEQLNSLYELCK